MPLTIAIDGPAGAGKSTVARRVAAALGFAYLDTGAMYRAVAWKALQEHLDTSDEAALAELAARLPLTLAPLTLGGQQAVRVDGEDVTLAIRSPEVSQLTSVISVFPAVREALVAQQREIGRNATPGVVLEGRDTGTVVFPDAEVKIFLTASPEQRALRRYEELKARGLDVEYAMILAEQAERDARDSERATAPLVPAPDAVTLDTDGLTIEEVVGRILELARKQKDGEEGSEDRRTEA